MAALLTLEEAAAALHETITVSALRAAIRDGRLPKRKLGRRYYLTPSEIEDFPRCLAHANPPVSTSEPTKSSGSSMTAPARSGRDMASASVARLKERLLATSQIASLPPAAVLPLRPT
jgi:hypothetical protein